MIGTKCLRRQWLICHHCHVSDSRTRQEGKARFTCHVSLSVASISTFTVARIRQIFHHRRGRRVSFALRCELSGRQGEDPPRCGGYYSCPAALIDVRVWRCIHGVSCAFRMGGWCALPLVASCILFFNRLGAAHDHHSLQAAWPRPSIRYMLVLVPRRWICFNRQDWVESRWWASSLAPTLLARVVASTNILLLPHRWPPIKSPYFSIQDHPKAYSK